MSSPKDLYLEERRGEILRLVNGKGRISVAELSEVLCVSEVTIRNDLQALADERLLVRTHGGAVAVEHGMGELSLAQRRQKQTTEKALIGRAAAALVADGDAIVLDSSSTCLAIARNLKNRRHLTVVTNSLTISDEMLDAPGVTVVMPGGRLRRDTASLVGTENFDSLRRLNLQKGFFGAHGISVSEGLTDVSLDEAEVKRPLVDMCRQVIAVLDSTKWGKVGLASFASIEKVGIVITDTAAPEELVETVRRQGIRVIRASVISLGE